MFDVTAGRSYEELRASFSWELPGTFNIGLVCADRHPRERLALVAVGPDGQVDELTFGEVADASSRLANGLRQVGIDRGDRVAVVLPQRPEAGIALLAVHKLGAIGVPLSPLFGPEALRYRLRDSDAAVVVTDARRAGAVAEAVAGRPGPAVLLVDPADGDDRALGALVDGASTDFTPVATAPDEPALLIYTSGTTGPPKGALHAHRVLLGHLPGFELMLDRFPQGDERAWTPAGWAWTGGLDLLLPAWFHGCVVVATNRTAAFDPHWAADIIRRHRVTAAVLPPGTLRLMRQAGIDLRDSDLRTVMTGGEPLGADTLAWSREHLGLEPNEAYGQTEANLVVGNSRALWPIRPGSMGRPYPGHEVRVLTGDGEPAPAGQSGEIAVRMPDPAAFLGYWNRPEATAAKVAGGWLRTGDVGVVDEQGYLWFTARDDDVINSAGCRIGPGEIEDCIASHPEVADAAVIGIPDELGGQVVKAFVVLDQGVAPTPRLEQEIRALVRTRLATYEYPREIEFLDELPTTTTGKVRRVALHLREKERRAGQTPRPADATDAPGTSGGQGR